MKKRAITLVVLYLLLPFQVASSDPEPICFGDPKSWPSGVYPFSGMKDIRIMSKSQPSKLSPGPAPVLIRACLFLKSYEVNIVSPAAPAGVPLAEGGCIDYEGGASTANYSCQESAQACDARAAIPAWCHFKSGQGKVAYNYWAEGVFALHSDFVKHKQLTAPFRVDPNVKITTVALLQTPHTYHVCIPQPAKFHYLVDGKIVEAAGDCNDIAGRSIAVERTGDGLFGGSFARIEGH